MTDRYYPSSFPRDQENNLKNLFLYLVKHNPYDRKQLMALIRGFSNDYQIKNFFPSLWMIYFVYLRHYSHIKVSQNFLNLLKVVKIRSLSGIVPLSIFTQPENSCPYNCVYCTKQKDAPKSYFSDEAAVMRAIRHQYDPFNQVKDRLIQFYLSGHPIDKIDLIIQGGTFSFYDNQYRQQFVKRAIDCCNSNIIDLIKTGNNNFEVESKSLEQAKSINEKARQRIVGITIETRPDFINKKEILFLRNLGVTRVELGVQSTDNNILRLIKRGHTTTDIIKVTKLLKESGFKITYHIMPGLPGSDVKKDINVLKELFSKADYKPDNLKFYPTQVVKGSELLKWYKDNKYIPLTEKQLTTIVTTFKNKIVPNWLRINRLVRDLTINDIEIDNFPSNFRQNIKNTNCQCIRCREIRDQKIMGQPKIKITKYLASKGIEYFIEFIDNNNRILGFLRLRIPEYTLNQSLVKNTRYKSKTGIKKDNFKNNYINDHKDDHFFFIDCLNHSVIIRELHIYGQQISLGQVGKVQHLGLGKQLIDQAIIIAKKYRVNKLAVISGIGVREYYKKLGFKYYSEGEYLIKTLD